MISFVSLFVGFVLGVVPVRLAASPGVDHVDLHLDGVRVAELRAPFAAPLDLGCEPSPHELVAVAFDAQGRRLQRIRQWINRPGPLAEASLAVDPSHRVASLTWRCLTGEVPRAIAVTLDGRPLRVENPERIDLPSLDPAQVHSLKAVLDFGNDVGASAEAVFGGPRHSVAVTEMTAVAVALDEGTTLPAPEEMSGWFAREGAPLEVTAVEEGPREVVFVCEGSALAPLGWTFFSDQRGSASGLPADLGFRFLWPVGRLHAQAALVSSLYPATRRFTPADGGVRWVAVKRLEWPPFSPKGERIADAVAVAGLKAAEQEPRRAVVLLLGPAASDGSLLTPAEAGTFLEKLNVPLAVWSIGRTPSPEAARWPAATRIDTARRFEQAVSGLVTDLGRQRIVWIAGSFLPQTIALGPAAAGIRLAR